LLFAVMQITTLKFSDMNWFLAKIIYQIICGDGDHAPQFDEQLRLVQAENKLKAIQKAKQIGEKEQLSFLNSRQKLVQWKFIDVTEIHPFNEPADGAELYSWVHEDEDCNHYVNMIRLKATDLLEESMRRSFLEKPSYHLASSIEECIGKIGY
jgi:hypothetical protein